MKQLRTKLLALTLPMVIVPIMLFGWITSQQIVGIAHDNIEQNINNYTNQTQGLLSHTISVGLSNVDLFAKHDLVIQYALASENERYSLLHPILLSAFHSFNKAYPEYEEIRFILPDGYEDVRYSNIEENITEEELNHPVIEKLNRLELESTYLFTTNPDNQMPVLYFARKVTLTNFASDSYGKAPELRGYLLLTTSVNKLQQHLNKTADNSLMQFMLVDQQQKPLLVSNTSENTTFTNEVLSTELLIEKIKVPTVGKNDSSPFKSSQLEIADNTYEIRSFPLGFDYSLIAVYQQSLYLKDGKKVQYMLLVLIVLSILILTILLVIGLRRFVLTPLAILNKATRRIGDNKEQVFIPVKTQDELGNLARAFESMNKKLLQATKKLKSQAFTDILTGLPNRLMFNDYLGRLLAYSKRNNVQFALLFIDLDDFKVVNDNLGHNMGDQLLQNFAQRIKDCVRTEDFVSSSFDGNTNGFIARLGGDEFIVVLNDIKKSNDISVVAQRIIESLSKPIMLKNYEHFGSTSLGISVYPHDGLSKESLVQNADIAMYHAKKMGKNSFHFYSHEMREEQDEINLLEAELRKAIHTKTGLEMHYQPKVTLNPQKVSGFEALIRWRLNNGEMVNPEKMIRVAEQRNLIIPLTEWIVDEVCRQNAFWQKNNMFKVPIAVNFSGIHIMREDISEMILSALTTHGLAAKYFEVEITESSIVDGSNNIIENLKKLQNLGMNIAVDDFGTGFSSLSYLSNFPINTVKIDRTFVNKINQGNHSAIVTAIIQMSHALGHTVVAEGVETQEQLDFLTRGNCNFIQGFFFSKALPADEVEAYLNNFNQQTCSSC